METIKLNWLDTQAANFEESRFFAMAMMLAIQTCWGSLAAGLTYDNETIFGLAACSIVTTLNNTVLIAQGPAKWCVAVFGISTIVNTLIIVIELIK